MPVYQIVPSRSQVWVEATTSVHPIHGEASGLTGAIEADVADGEVTLTKPPQLRFEMPIKELRSGNPMYDSEMQRRVDARRYPTITGDATELTELGSGRYRLRGDLAFHGVTRAVEGEVKVQAEGGRTLLLEGAQTFDVREFGIQPPRILMLKVHPDVAVRVRIVAERSD
jgi:polyisoprenoid-binding protein YceI